LRRGVQSKANALAGFVPQYFTEVNGVLNSGNGAGGSIFGVTLPGPGNYNTYNSADIFDAYDVNGNPVAPCSLITNPDCTSIRSIQISANVAPTYNDPVTRIFPVFSMTSKARLNF